MDFPIQKGSKGADVVAVQQCLNRLGMLLVCDGSFGNGTARAIQTACTQLGIPEQAYVDAALWDKLKAIPEPCSDLPTEGVTFIALAEVSSRAAYEESYSHPTWPSEHSGMTIGIGYDLQFSTLAEFAADWRNHLDGNDYRLLTKWLRRVGSTDGMQELKKTYQPFSAAWAVFCERTIPSTVVETRKAFPGYDGLPPLCKSALVSLVYNRGTSLSGDNRREMKKIHDLIKTGDLAAVPEQFCLMKRLWKSLPGLQKRRDDEAAMWYQGMVGKS